MAKPRKVLLALSVITLLAVTGFNSGSAKNRAPVHQRTLSATAQTAVVQMKLKKQINLDRSATWKWQDRALMPRTPSSYSERRAKSVRYLRWVANHWSRLHVKSRQHAKHPPHLAMWLCIHGGEASWIDHASHNPHYGGLQMGYWFMQTYAPGLLSKLGTADNWSPMTQIWVAEHAYARTGYSRRWLLGQWSATAPPCI